MGSSRKLQSLLGTLMEVDLLQTQTRINEASQLASQHDPLHRSRDCCIASFSYCADFSETRGVPDVRMCLSSRPVSPALSFFIQDRIADQGPLGLISLPGSSSTFAWKSMRQSMGPRPMEASQIRISPSQSPEMGARRMPPNTWAYQSRS